MALLLAMLAGFHADSRAQPTVPVVTAVATQQDIHRVVPMNGTVTSPRSARLSPATSGQVYALHVDAGSRVTRGDVLLELDSELAELQLQSDEARTLQSRRSLEDSRRRLREAQELIPQASIAESTVRDLEAEVALDEATLQQVSADAKLQRAVLERHLVRAPFDGVVSAKLTELGEWVTPGTAVLGLVATEGLRLDFSVAEDYLPDVRGDARVRYAVGAARDTRFTGTVDTVVPVSDPNARTFLLRVTPGPERPVLRPGMSVTATLAIDMNREGIVVPRDALLRYSDGRQVLWLVEEEAGVATVREQRVQTGLQFDGLVEIRNGIGAGTQVVVEGNEALRDGQRVELRARTGNTGGEANPDV